MRGYAPRRSTLVSASHRSTVLAVLSQTSHSMDSQRHITAPSPNPLLSCLLSRMVSRTAHLHYNLHLSYRQQFAFRPAPTGLRSTCKLPRPTTLHHYQPPLDTYLSTLGLSGMRTMQYSAVVQLTDQCPSLLTNLLLSVQLRQVAFAARYLVSGIHHLQTHRNHTTPAMLLTATSSRPSLCTQNMNH